MATRKASVPPAQANLTPEQMRIGVLRINRLIEDIESFDETLLTKRWGPEQSSLETTIEGVLASVFGPRTVEYHRYADAMRLDDGPVTIAYSSYDQQNDAAKARIYVAEGKRASVLTLKSALKWLQDEISFHPESEAVANNSQAARNVSRKIFIVHGHDDVARLTVARFIEKIGFDAVILSERPNQGRTVIEKIEAHGDVGFAVVLLTPDDLGGKSIDTLKPRARQNVLLELGYFIGRLGRQNVFSLAKGDLEIPTDFAGMVWEPLDDAGAWRMKLAQELSDTGNYAIDWNIVMK
ncbi:nucleotide-binding protein [Janthinobacterium sp. P210006]|uniref:nucleotide-binding protein n=1 Tax=Janthinobacterium sp. P210006 TaxID=3112939 RepID=UPI002E257DC2|nr:nucleotide-binding protein [Janthinobacterium sp. P210006]